MVNSKNSISDARADFFTRLGIPIWLGCFLLAFLGLSLIEANRVENRLAALGQSVEDLPQRMDAEFDRKLETLRSDLIEKFFSRAQKLSASGNFKGASSALWAASILTQVVREDGIPADSNFFRRAVDSLDAIAPRAKGPSALSEPFHAAYVELASYRSSLQKLPSQLRQPQSFSRLNSMEIARLLGVSDGFVWFGPPGKDMMTNFSPPQNGWFGSQFRNLFLEGGQQTLDNASWKNVVFINMHIIYKGGPVELIGVKFVHCTFRLISDDHGTWVANYTALDKSSLKIG